MYPFEVWNESEQRTEFHFDRFAEYRRNLFQQYPVQFGHNRVELELCFQSDRLEDVWVHEWNPHHELGNHHLSVYDCFYDSSDWSTIFEAYPTHNHSQQHMTWRIFIEEGHQEPWGEPIRIMSTSRNINDDSSHRFAYFREKYWKIITWGKHEQFVPRFILDDIMIDYRNWPTWTWEFEYEVVQNTKTDWLKEGF